jgi:hypothetical protein
VLGALKGGEVPEHEELALLARGLKGGGVGERRRGRAGLLLDPRDDLGRGAAAAKVRRELAVDKPLERRVALDLEAPGDILLLGRVELAQDGVDALERGDGRRGLGERRLERLRDDGGGERRRGERGGGGGFGRVGRPALALRALGARRAST